MESKFQTSFIPKKSLDDGNVKIKTPISILFVSSVIIMLLTLGVSSGVFYYQKTLESKIASKDQTLKEKFASLDSSSIQDIVSIDSKLKIASNLLNNHTAVSRLFPLLQQSTLKNVRFTDFSFSYLSPSKVAITMKGQATGFEVLAKQIEAFTSNPSIKDNFKDPIFSDFALDDKGNVGFSLLTNIDSSVILYKDDFATSTKTITTASSTVASSTNTQKP